MNIRCGWVTAGVTGTYCRYAAAGDQYCGRVVSGLPLFSFRFGILPPRFVLNDEEGEALDRLITTLFPSLPDDLWKIVKHGIAALALRQEWLAEKLDRGHCLFQCSIFWNEDYNKIKSKVKIELGVGDQDLEIDQVTENELKCTGIPNHVVLLASQRKLVSEHREMKKVMRLFQA